MSLHPVVKQYLESVPTSSPSYTLTLEEQRSNFNSFIVPLNKRTVVYSIEDRTICGLDYDIPIRIYTPAEGGPFPLLLFFHGGGFNMGSIETHDEIVRRIANESGYKVISVEYRLAPEHPFPAAIADCYTATKWVVEHAKEINGNPNQIAVGGDSAGGTLASAVTLMARDLNEFEISKQVLIYPAMDLNVKLLRYDSRIENAEGYGLEFASLEHTYNLYLTDPEDVHQTYASPINAKEFSYLPSTLVITAEYDPLRDEGELYANKLIEAGIYAEIKRYSGVIHGFLLRFKDLDEYKGVYSLIGTFLKKQDI